VEPLKAKVRNGRIILDEPADLPEGEVDLVPLDEVFARGGDFLDKEERAALHRSVDQGIEDFERGEGRRCV
jgi:hypothetical protein